MKKHKISADRLVKIPQYLTPSLPKRGEFLRFTTNCPLDLWNAPTLEMVAKHSCSQHDRIAALSELERRAT